MTLIFSKAWLFIFLAVIALSLLRIFMKARAISRGLGKGTPIVKVGKPAAAEQGGDIPRAQERLAEASALRRAGRSDEALALYDQALGLLPPSDFSAEHAKARLDEGTLLLEMARESGSADRLLAAAKAFFAGAEAVREGPWHLRSKLLFALGDAYERMAKGGEDEPEALRRSAAAMAEAARLLNVPGQEEDRSLVMVRLGRAFFKLSKVTGERGDLENAARAFAMALENFPREKKPDLYRKVVAALAELERELER